MEGGTGNQLDRRIREMRSSREHPHRAIRLVLISNVITTTPLHSNREFHTAVYTR